MGMFNPRGLRQRDDAMSFSTTARLEANPARTDAADSTPPTAHVGAPDPLWVIYASETGVAEHLAQDARRTLQDAGVASRLLPFDAVDFDALQTAGTALFLVSTCYDGEPPDMAAEFLRDHMRHPAQLPCLRYGMLALGDSCYARFCAFGRQLHQWLQASGAQAMFEPVEMDDEDEAAARRWQDRLGALIQSRRGAGYPAA